MLIGQGSRLLFLVTVAESVEYPVYQQHTLLHCNARPVLYKLAAGHLKAWVEQYSMGFQAQGGMQPSRKTHPCNNGNSPL